MLGAGSVVGVGTRTASEDELWTEGAGSGLGVGLGEGLGVIGSAAAAEDPWAGEAEPSIVSCRCTRTKGGRAETAVAVARSANRMLEGSMVVLAVVRV